MVFIPNIEDRVNDEIKESKANLAYKIITDRIIEKLEQGTVPWHQPWSAEMPKNLVTKREYRGINVFVLACMGYVSPYWVTYKQAKDLGGYVRKGERATPVVFWKICEKECENAETGEVESLELPLLRYYNVFNTQQCERLDEKIPPLLKREFQPLERAEAIVQNMPKLPSIEYREPRAFYRPSTDTVNMPRPELFQPHEEYYSTLFHELTHSTGHPSRLGRLKSLDGLPPFGSHDYSQEELVAEMGAAFLYGYSGIENKTIDSSAAYIAGWLKKLRDDRRLVVIAAAQAQKAADFIRGTIPQESALR